MSVAVELACRIAGIDRGAAPAANLLARSRVMLSCMLACLACGCIEAEERIEVRGDGSLSVKATIKVDPQYESLVLPEMKKELPKQVPPGTRLDFSQRIDGKAAVIIEAEGAVAAAMQAQDGSTTITVSDGGFMKKRYEYREVVQKVPEIPFPHRALVTLPGLVDGVVGGKKIAADTVEFDRTHAKRGATFVATSTAFAFSLGSGDTTVAAVASPGSVAWLIPVSVGAILVGVALLLTGWVRSRRAVRAVSMPAVAAPPAAAHEPLLVGEGASMFCTECGAANVAGRKFCGQCGHAMG